MLEEGGGRLKGVLGRGAAGCSASWEVQQVGASWEGGVFWRGWEECSRLQRELGGVQQAEGVLGGRCSGRL
jgi:hypothetical protein